MVDKRTIDGLVKTALEVREALLNPRSICIKEGDRVVEIHFYPEEKKPPRIDEQLPAEERHEEQNEDDLDFYHES